MHPTTSETLSYTFWEFDLITSRGRAKTTLEASPCKEKLLQWRFTHMGEEGVRQASSIALIAFQAIKTVKISRTWDGKGEGGWLIAVLCFSIYQEWWGEGEGCVTSLVELVVQWPCPVPCCPSCQSQRLRIPTGKVATALSVCHNLFERISQRCRI